MRPFACDAVIIEDNKIVLIQCAADPFRGEWAVPGGRIEDNETAEQCLKREVKEETGLDVESIMLVGIYIDPNRDPRGVIAACYLCKRTGGQLKGGDDAADAKWFPLDAVPQLAADHLKIVKDAIRYATVKKGFTAVCDDLLALGLVKEDAEVVADCIKTKKVCSWSNNEIVSEKTIAALQQYLTINGHPIVVNINAMPNRSKYIWEVKLKK